MLVLPVVDESPTFDESLALEPLPTELEPPTTPPEDADPIALPEALLPVPDSPADEPLAVISPDELALDAPCEPDESEVELEPPEPVEPLDPLVPEPSEPDPPALLPDDPLELPPLEPLPELELPELPSPPPPPPAVAFCELPPLDPLAS